MRTICQPERRHRAAVMSEGFEARRCRLCSLSGGPPDALPNMRDTKVHVSQYIGIFQVGNSRAEKADAHSYKLALRVLLAQQPVSFMCLNPLLGLE